MEVQYLTAKKDLILSIDVNSFIWTFFVDSFDTCPLVATLYVKNNLEAINVYMYKNCFQAIPTFDFSFQNMLDISFKELQFNFASATIKEKTLALENACKIIEKDFTNSLKKYSQQNFH